MTLDFILHYVVVLHVYAIAIRRPSHPLIDMTYCRAETSDTGVDSGSRGRLIDRYGFCFSATL
jgi:hypothetical protein